MATMTTAAMAIPSAAVAPVAPATVGGSFGNVSLYVGDLEQNVVEGQLYDLFSQAGTVVSVRVCRDQNKRSSLGYAYVNYSTPQEAANAKETFNFAPINGKPIRIMYSHRDPSIRKTGYANVFIKNLDLSIDNKALHDTFAAFGNVLSCKVVTDNSGQSKGFGYVQFESEEAAQHAIDRLNGMLINDKQVYVGKHIRRQERLPNMTPKFTNVYVKNLSEKTTDEDLKEVFEAYGTITSAVVMTDQNGKSRGFGFVNFQSTDAAAVAVENLNGIVNDDKVWYVGRAQRKAEREAELKAKFEQERISRYEKLQAANLYLKNLDDSIDTTDKLRELFSEFGTITSCKIMLDPHGVSKGSGFVAFSAPEEATKALAEMNGKMIGKKPLYVAVAQRKEDRKARLQAYFSQLRSHGAMTPLASGIPGYPHATAHRLGQPVYYGQGGPGLLQPQPAGYGFQQQLLPGIRPGLTQNYFVPYNVQRQGQSGQRMGVRRGGNSHQMQQQQMLMHRNTNQGFRYMGNGRDGLDPSAVPIMPLPFEVSRMPVNPIDVQGPNLISALASASPKKSNEMLGEQLYPLVQRFEPKHVAKVTGMLLEMDQTEVLHLIESPEALKEKVAEAMAVLRDSAAAGDGDVSKELGVVGTD
ncbi:hypothetical protein CCACVL1_03012 [Corchorus capsularis]|uniref:Polyadenylate-binding protein n=1 Tax=Corchorus capsularis TaxID=210143 RepID=A0A1R3K432_COCAP|nr:hypothetical protein CCACVL1_03012 [Corchorus capsularis]